MTLPGTAFLALWNERAATRDDYDVWHTREHVPERLTVPGILAGQRYADGDGPLPSYFTLYSLRDLDVLKSPQYLAVVEQPTSWSLSMRPAMSHWYRRGCDTRFSLGGGTGGCLAAILLSGSPADAQVRDSFLKVSDLIAFCGLHLGQVCEVPALPFADNAPAHLPDADAILLVEGFDWNALGAALPELDGLVHEAGYRPLLGWTRYRLAYAMDDTDRGSLFALDADALSQRAQGESGDCA